MQFVPYQSRSRGADRHPSHTWRRALPPIDQEIAPLATAPSRGDQTAPANAQPQPAVDRVAH